MTLDALIMFAGACVALLPFLGFPNSLDKFLFLAAGILVVGLGIVVRRRSSGRSSNSERRPEGEERSHIPRQSVGGVFAESMPMQMTPRGAAHEEV